MMNIGKKLKKGSGDHIGQPRTILKRFANDNGDVQIYDVIDRELYYGPHNNGIVMPPDTDLVSIETDRAIVQPLESKLGAIISEVEKYVEDPSGTYPLTRDNITTIIKYLSLAARRSNGHRVVIKNAKHWLPITIDKFRKAGKIEDAEAIELMLDGIETTNHSAIMDEIVKELHSTPEEQRVYDELLNDPNLLERWEIYSIRSDSPEPFFFCNIFGIPLGDNKGIHGSLWIPLSSTLGLRMHPGSSLKDHEITKPKLRVIRKLNTAVVENASEYFGCEMRKDELLTYGGMKKMSPGKNNRRAMRVMQSEITRVATKRVKNLNPAGRAHVQMMKKRTSH